jgi:Plastocyanin
MKTMFTLRIFRSLILTSALVYLSMSLTGQTSHPVTVSNYSFSPKNLTITAGDEVAWTNTSGSHNVDGETATFPSNPVSFGNSVGTGWTYKFTFNTAGTYNYQCDPHAGMGMVGQIIVTPKTTTSVKLLTEKANVLLFPNPATQYIELQTSSDFGAVILLKIYSITGSLVAEQEVSNDSEPQKINVSNLKSGMYLIEINSSANKMTLKFLKQ